MHIPPTLDFLASTFGGPPLILFFLSITYLYIVCKAIARAADLGKGVEVPLWVIVIITIPVFGPLAALIHYPKQKGRKR